MRAVSSPCPATMTCVAPGRGDRDAVRRRGCCCGRRAAPARCGRRRRRSRTRGGCRAARPGTRGAPTTASSASRLPSTGNRADFVTTGPRCAIRYRGRARGCRAGRGRAGADVGVDERVHQRLDRAGADVMRGGLGLGVGVGRLREREPVGEDHGVVDAVEGDGAARVGRGRRELALDRRAGEQHTSVGPVTMIPEPGCAQHRGERMFGGELERPGADVVVRVGQLQVQLLGPDQPDPGQGLVADLDGDVMPAAVRSPSICGG